MMKLEKMLQGQMLPGLMSPRQLPTNIDDQTNQPSNFGWVRDMASFVFVNYRDPKIPKICKLSSRDIAASSRIEALFG